LLSLEVVFGAEVQVALRCEAGRVFPFSPVDLFEQSVDLFGSRNDFFEVVLQAPLQVEGSNAFESVVFNVVLEE
jgi:hypothetical protein